MSIFVTVPIHDREEYVGPCLDALEKSGMRYTLSVVANGCTFDPGPYLKRADFADETPEALGPPAARNVSLGHRQPGQDWLSLDSDVVFQTPHWLQMLYKTLYSRRFGAVSPAIDNMGGPLFHDTRPGEGVKVVKVLPVGARLVRGEVADQLGYLRVYQHYGCEDIDYDARIQALGYELAYDTDVVVTHPGIPSDDKWKRQSLELCIPKCAEWKKLYERGKMLHKPEPEMDFIPDMNPRWLDPNLIEEYGTHIAGLRWAVEHTEGPVLELGMGRRSTPYLNKLSNLRQVVSYEKDKRWLAEGKKRFEAPTHWIVDSIPPGFWGVVLIDCEGPPRGDYLRQLREVTKVFVLHDTEAPQEPYGWSEADFDSFRYRADYGDKPRTTLLSDSVDVRSGAGRYW